MAPTCSSPSAGPRSAITTSFRPVFRSRGVSLDFWKVAMRPGKPLMAGRLQAHADRRAAGQPGLLHGGRHAVPQASRRHGSLAAPTCRSIVAAPLRRRCRRTASAPTSRARWRPRTTAAVTVQPLPRQDSSLLSIYASANALLVRPPHAPPARGGRAMPLRRARLNARPCGTQLEQIALFRFCFRGVAGDADAQAARTASVHP